MSDSLYYPFKMKWLGKWRTVRCLCTREELEQRYAPGDYEITGPGEKRFDPYGPGKTVQRQLEIPPANVVDARHKTMYRCVSGEGMVWKRGETAIGRCLTAAHFDIYSARRATVYDPNAPDLRGLLPKHFVSAQQHGLRIVSPNVFAVFKFITSLNLEGCSIGKSPGLSPLSIFSMSLDARINCSSQSNLYAIRTPSAIPSATNGNRRFRANAPTCGTSKSSM